MPIQIIRDRLQYSKSHYSEVSLTLKIIIIVILILLILVILFRHLIKQSQNPSGIIGTGMMKLWNNAYLPMVKWSLTSIDQQDRAKVLDIGIGNGMSTKYLKESFPTSTVYGIDISETAISQAKKNSLDPSVILEVKNVENTGYDDLQFDLICAFQTHFHWQNLDAALAELKRILSTNGTIVIACEVSKVKYYLPDLQDIEDFRKYLAECGLQLSSHHQQNGWLCYIISHKN